MEFGPMDVIERFVSDDEHSTYFSNLNGLRTMIVKALPIKKNQHVLDLATGYGFYAIELWKLNNTLKITGIDISQNDVFNARNNIKELKLEDQIKIIQMDATKMDFPDEEFDMVVNFLGLEDIHMTKGKIGVQKTFSEVNRVLKPEGYFSFVVMPTDEMETEAQKIEVELFSYICNATWLKAKEYEEILNETGFKLIRKEEYYTGKKLTSKQIKEEIEFACNNVQKIYGIETPTFYDVWDKFGKRIEKHGTGHYSKVVLFISQKAD